MLNASIVDYLTSTLTDVAKSALMTKAAQTDVIVKTNLGPEFHVDPFSSEPSILDRLGIQTAVTLVDKASGQVIYQSATPPPTDPVRVGILLAGAFGLIALLLRGLRLR